jgi:hypothetical protein
MDNVQNCDGYILRLRCCNYCADTPPITGAKETKYMLLDTNKLLYAQRQ